MLRTGIVVLSMFSVPIAFTQNTINSPTGIEILQRVGQHYSDAQSYRIEAVEERTISNDYQRDWQKKVLIAEEAPGNRFYYEGRASMGSSLRISDGNSIWVYHMSGNSYTKKTAAADAPTVGVAIPPSEIALYEASWMRESLAGIIRDYNSADRLPDEALTIHGREISCYVVQVKSEDRRKKIPKGSYVITYWIDKGSNIVLQSTESEHGFTRTMTDEIPVEIESKTIYTSTQLNPSFPAEHFNFAPPTSAKLVDNFSLPVHVASDTNMAGKQLPPLIVKSADGSRISLDSFHGRPMLIDIWATWCAFCIQGMPQLAKLYQQAMSKGIVSITIDRDDDARTAIDFLKQKGYDWPNFHDEGAEKGALGESAVPRTLIVDKDGKIVFDKVNATDEQLRKELVKLDSQYSSLTVN